MNYRSLLRLFAISVILAGLTNLQAVAQTQRTIAVIGHAEAKTSEKGERVVRISVSAKESTAAHAFARLADLMRTMKHDLETAGASRKEIIEGQVSMNPSYDYSKPGMPPSITGYQLMQTLTARSENDQVLPQLIDAATAAGATSVSIGFESKPDQENNSDLQVEALKDAHERAEELAKASGVKLGDLISVSQVEQASGAGPMSEREREEMEHGGGGAAAKPETLELKVIYSVR